MMLISGKKTPYNQVKLYLGKKSSPVKVYSGRKYDQVKVRKSSVDYTRNTLGGIYICPSSTRRR